MEIDFELWVDVKGYRLEQGRIVGQGGSKQLMRLKDFPPLYPAFAQVKTDAELLSFVNRFGMLGGDAAEEVTGDGEVERHIDDLGFLLEQASTMRTMLEVLRGKLGDFPTQHSGDTFEDAIPSIAKRVKVVGGIPLPARLWAALTRNRATGVWVLKFLPPTLLDAIWLQLGQAVASDADLKECPQCRKWFEAGPRSGKRRHAMFCSRKCKTDFHSLQRSR